MRYRNSECVVTPEEATQEVFKTECVFCGDINRNYRTDIGAACKINTHDNNNGCGCDGENDSDDLMSRLSELKFAAIDLSLFLDTHPHDKDALEMLKKISKTMESLKADYIRKYGPLMPWESSADAPFQWASAEYKWPWEK